MALKSRTEDGACIGVCFARFFPPLRRMVRKLAYIRTIFGKTQNGGLAKLKQLLATAMASIKQIE